MFSYWCHKTILSLWWCCLALKTKITITEAILALFIERKCISRVHPEGVSNCNLYSNVYNILLILMCAFFILYHVWNWDTIYIQWHSVSDQQCILIFDSMVYKMIMIILCHDQWYLILNAVQYFILWDTF